MSGIQTVAAGTCLSLGVRQLFFLPNLAILFLSDVLGASQGPLTRQPGSGQVNKQCVTVRIN